MGCSQSKKLLPNKLQKLRNLNDFFAGKSFLITGGTGYLGKILIEKLLRSYSSIKNIFVLVRPKGKLSAQQNFQTNLVDSLIIKNLEKSNIEKLKYIEGDISLPHLGISQPNIKILKTEINFVVHCAANLDFHAPLQQITKQNVQATLQLYDMVKDSKKLEHFVYISTIFCNGDQGDTTVQEKIYDFQNQQDPQYTYHKILSNKLLKDEEKYIIGKIPNSYCFSKNLCEKMLKIKQQQQLNKTISIIRPSVILCTQNDPMPGYIDQLVGLGIVHYYTGTGQMKYFYTNGKYSLDVITGDATVSQIIMTLGLLANSKQFSVVNCGTNFLNPLTNQVNMDTCQEYWKQHPIKKQLQLPQCEYISDFLLLLQKYNELKKNAQNISDQKQRVILEQSIEKAININMVFKTINEKNTIFESKLIYQMAKYLSQQDREILKEYDVQNIDWKYTINLFQYGIQKFILKQQNVQEPQPQALSTNDSQ